MRPVQRRGAEKESSFFLPFKEQDDLYIFYPPPPTVSTAVTLLPLLASLLPIVLVHAGSLGSTPLSCPPPPGSISGCDGLLCFILTPPHCKYEVVWGEPRFVVYNPSSYLFSCLQPSDLQTSDRVELCRFLIVPRHPDLKHQTYF